MTAKGSADEPRERIHVRCRGCLLAAYKLYLATSRFQEETTRSRWKSKIVRRDTIFRKWIVLGKRCVPDEGWKCISFCRLRKKAVWKREKVVLMSMCDGRSKLWRIMFESTILMLESYTKTPLLFIFSIYVADQYNVHVISWAIWQVRRSGYSKGKMPLFLKQESSQFSK